MDPPGLSRSLPLKKGGGKKGPGRETSFLQGRHRWQTDPQPGTDPLVIGEMWIVTARPRTYAVPGPTTPRPTTSPGLRTQPSPPRPRPRPHPQSQPDSQAPDSQHHAGPRLPAPEAGLEASFSACGAGPRERTSSAQGGGGGPGTVTQSDAQVDGAPCGRAAGGRARKQRPLRPHAAAPGLSARSGDAVSHRALGAPRAAPEARARREGARRTAPACGGYPAGEDGRGTVRARRRYGRYRHRHRQQQRCRRGQEGPAQCSAAGRAPACALTSRARQQQFGEPQLAVLPPDPAREVSLGRPGACAPARPGPGALSQRFSAPSSEHGRSPAPFQPCASCLSPLQERADVQQRAHGRRPLHCGPPGRGPESACPQGW